MILRVFHGVPAPGGEEGLVAAIREHALPTLERLPALTGFQLGIRRAEASEIVIVTVWTDVGAILASGNPLTDAPRTIGGAPAFFVASHADHYELVLGEERGAPMPGARLRVSSATLAPGGESAFFDAARAVASRLEVAHELALHLLGRRTVASHTEVCAVTVWPDGGIDGPDGPTLLGGDELAGYFLAPPAIRRYEPIVVADR